MGWYGGEWIEGATCEDAPCCGCCGQQADIADSYDGGYEEALDQYEAYDAIETAGGF
jgi:hypothetical protein